MILHIPAYIKKVAALWISAALLFSVAVFVAKTWQSEIQLLPEILRMVIGFILIMSLFFLLFGGVEIIHKNKENIRVSKIVLKLYQTKFNRKVK